MADATRPARPKRAGSGAADDDRARKLDVHVWYPARRGSAIGPMTFADAMAAHLAGQPAAALARRDADVRGFLAQFGAVTDDAWTRLKQTPLLARPDAPAAGGRFPLIVGSLRPLSTSVTNEYLASHGYVVAMVDGEEMPAPADPGAGLDVELPRHGVRHSGAAQASRRRRRGARGARFQRVGLLAGAAGDAASGRGRRLRSRERDLRRSHDVSALSRVGVRDARAPRAVPPYLQPAAQQAGEPHRGLRGHALLHAVPLPGRRAGHPPLGFRDRGHGGQRRARRIAGRTGPRFSRRSR